MNVALICTEKNPVPPLRGGAIQTYIGEVAPILAQEHQITVISVRGAGLPKTSQEDGVHFVRIPRSSEQKYVQQVAAYLSDQSFDVVHIFNRPAWVRALQAACKDARIVLSLHNEMFAPRKLGRKQGRKCIRTVSRIVTVSRFIADGVRRLYPEADRKLTTIYSGVNLQQFIPGWSREGEHLSQAVRHELGLGSRPLILQVSRLSEKKGSQVLIRAHESVLRQHPDAVLLIVGSRWYGDRSLGLFGRQVKRMARSLGKSVLFTGFVTPAQVHRYFAAGDVFVCASQWEEPLARVHYEAMAAGLPLITTRRGGNPELVDGRELGIVVDRYDDPEAFALAIQQLLSQPTRAREMGRNARREAEQKYGWKRVVTEILSVYDQLR